VNVKWKDFFRIEELDGITMENNFWVETEYLLIDIDGKLHGNYRDKKYAVKQAKYKFKRLQSRLEKILLS